MAYSLALLSAVLRIVHPKLYRAGKLAMSRLREYEEYREVGNAWPGVFSALCLMSNRLTPFHRDVNGRNAWYDLLASIGPYRNATMVLPDIGLKLKYETGCVVAICGKPLRHGVLRCDGERVCFAFVFRNLVHHYLDVEAPHWMSLSKYSYWMKESETR